MVEVSPVRKLMNRIVSTVFLYVLGALLATLAVAAPKSQVRVYYFYTTYRCPTCYKLQLYTKKAIDIHFGEAIADGTVEFRAVNVDEKENKHFVEDYQLFTKSVVVALIKNGTQIHYKNLDKIWQLVGNEQRFVDYIKAETEAYLAEAAQ